MGTLLASVKSSVCVVSPMMEPVSVAPSSSSSSSIAASSADKKGARLARMVVSPDS